MILPKFFQKTFIKTFPTKLTRNLCLLQISGTQNCPFIKNGHDLSSLTYSSQRQSLLNINRFSFSPRKRPQSSDDAEKDNKSPQIKYDRPSNQQLCKMIFNPQILLFHIKKIIDEELFTQKDSEKQVQNELNPITKLQNHQSNFINFIRTAYFLRYFINIVLKLDKRIAIMNQVDQDQDYKIDMVYKIMEKLKDLHKLLQNQINTLENHLPKQNFQHSNSQGKSHKSLQDRSMIFEEYFDRINIMILCQILVFSKMLQLAPNDKSFNILKFIYQFKTWPQKFQYFKQSLPLGVHNSHFQQSKKILGEIISNIYKVQNYAVISNHENYVQNEQNSQYKIKRTSIQDTIKKLRTVQYSQFLKSIGIQRQNEDEKLISYFSQYRQELQSYFQQNKSTQMQRPIDKQLFDAFNDSPEAQYIIQQRQRKLQVNQHFVESCLLILLSKQLQTDTKIDMLNDMRNFIYNKYLQYQQELQLRRERNCDEKYHADRKHKDRQNQKLIELSTPKNFMEYARANLVATWTIYQVQDLRNHKVFKNKSK